MLRLRLYHQTLPILLMLMLMLMFSQTLPRIHRAKSLHPITRLRRRLHADFFAHAVAPTIPTMPTRTAHLPLQPKTPPLKPPLLLSPRAG